MSIQTQSNVLRHHLEKLLPDAATLVRQRALLPAFDWRYATPCQVASLLEILAAEHVTVPLWLAKGLLIAGHTLPTEALSNCPGELHTLAALNSVGAAGALDDAVEAQIHECVQSGTMEPGVAAPLVARLVALGAGTLASRLAVSQFRDSPEAMRLVRDQLNDNIAARPHIRLRLTGTSTTHSLAEALRPAFAHIGLQAQTDEASFGALIPELMSPVENSNALVVLLDAEDFSPKDWRKTADEFQADLNHRLSSLTGAIKYYCNTHGTPVLINTLPASAVPAAGHIDRSYATGTTRVIDHVNRALADAAQSTPLMQLVDADHALAAIAPDKRTDPRLWHYGRLAYSEASTRAFAQAFALAWQARTRGPAKVLALDFDNTLWGGVYGDDGIEKLACGDDFPGNAYKALQQECLRLKSQGMLLVGLSKNNPDAIDVFANHPGIVLTRQDFAAMAINWEPKPNNIVNIARDLGLGLDSFVFLDDSAHEREAMRRMCPSVTVPEMPNDASRRPLWLRSLTYTWPLRLTDEDARRSDMYQAERNASELRAAANSYEEYLAGLEQQLTVEPVRPETLARAAQLHQRTNQFNLSNRRYDESQIKTFMTGASGSGAFVGRVKDRFGDHGIVLAACMTRDGQTARIESFVMSCRVIGRQIETAFLQSVIEYLERHGAKRIEAIFRPTAKNSIASGLYPSMGFFSEQFGNDEELWVYRTTDGAETGASSVSVTVEWEQA